MVPQSEVDKARTITERFMIRWRGEPDPKHVEAVDAYWVSAAEHGMNASTFTARVITSTGADVAAALSGAVGAMSGPLHGGAPSRVLHMLDGVEQQGDATAYVKGVLDKGDRLMGFGHRVYRAEDPRARVLRSRVRAARAPRYEAAAALEKAALDELHARRPDRVLATNVEFWAAVILDFAEVPPLHVHADVHLRADGRLVGAHPRAEADRPAHPALVPLHRRGAAPARGRRRLDADIPAGRVPLAGGGGRWTAATGVRVRSGVTVPVSVTPCGRVRQPRRARPRPPRPRRER